MALRKVGRDEFFATVGKMNVHPSPEPDAVYWKTPNGVLKGKTTPGYMGGAFKEYFVVEEPEGRP